MTQRNITLTLTDAGRTALINAASNALNVQFTAVALGSGTVALDNTAKALTSQQEQQPIFSSSSPAPGQLSISALFSNNPAAQYAVTELGLIGDGVLFGVWSTTDPTQALVVRTPGVPYTSTITVGYAQLPSQNISVVIQPLDAAVQALLRDAMTNTINSVFSQLAPIADTGQVNAYAAANVVPLTAATLVHGVRQRVVIAHTNTGASTYSPDSLPQKPILGTGLAALQGLELVATETADLEYVIAASVNAGNGAWLLIRCGGGSAQLAAGSYGVTPPQFDSTTKLATTAFVQRMGMQSSNFFSANSTQTLGAGVIGGTVQASGSNGPITLTIPLTSNVAYGSRIEFINSSNYPMVIAAQGASDKLYGVNAAPGSITVLPGDTLTIECQGSTIWIATGGSNQLPASSAMAGANWTTPPQFDNTTKLATTAFVQRALGNFQTGSRQITANTTLTAANSGTLYQITGAYTITLPAISTMPSGAAFCFSNNTAALATIVTNGTDMFAPGGASSISLATDNLWIAALGGVWLMVSGSAALPYASAMAGANWTTAPAGDSSKKLATTAFVQRAIGGFANFVAYNVNTLLTNAQANYAIQSYGGTITFTLPVGGTMVPGSTMTFYNNGAGVLSITTQGSDFIYAGSNVQPVALQIGDSLTLMSRGGVEWDVIGGSAALQFGQSTRGQTAPQFDNSTRLVTSAFVQRAIGNLRGTFTTSTSGNLGAAQAGKQVYVSAGGTTQTINFGELVDGTRMVIYANYSTPGTTTLAINGSANFVAVGNATVPTVTLNAGESISLVADNTNINIEVSTANLRYSAAFGASLGSPGYQKLPSGLIVQWGSFQVSGTGSSGVRTQTFNFPIAFKSACLSINANDVGNACYSYGVTSVSSSQGIVYVPAGQLGASSTPSMSGVAGVQWLALGA